MSKMLGIFGFSGHYFHVKYNTLYFISIKCVLCEAVGRADQNHKTFKTFLFLSRKKKQKNPPSATPTKAGLLPGWFKNSRGTGSRYLEGPAQDPPLVNRSN